MHSRPPLRWLKRAARGVNPAMISKAPKYPSEDLFEHTKMSFGDHLEELRSSLIKSLFGILICILIGLYAGGYVVDWIKSPLEAALADYYEDKAITDLKAQYGGTVPLEIENVVRDQHVRPAPVNL